MHREFPPLSVHGTWRHALILLIAVCLLFPGASPAAIGWDGHEPGCTGALYQPGECAYGNQRNADKTPHAQLETLPGTPGVPLRRAHGRWYAAVSDASRTVRSVWLTVRAHEPPKTVLFCTLLI